jgi:uncharacterized protein (DUF952 family)
MSPVDLARNGVAGLVLGLGDRPTRCFIHFSTAVQLRETAARHFAGQDGLALVAVDETVLGPALKWNQREMGLSFRTFNWSANPMRDGTKEISNT